MSDEFQEDLDWNSVKKEYLSKCYKIQVKYGLAFLMILAFGSFNRAWLKKEQEISSKLIYFWILLSREVTSRSKHEECSWNLYLEGLPFWSNLNRKFIKKLEKKVIKSIITEATHQHDEEKKEYNLFLDFTRLLEKKEEN